ncbi:MAG TPA: hypothetical protein VKZ83_07425 [Phototrophicaceae bacterium]|nr:hypothetical protein [Phototrophicaceae bacterium]
MTVRALGALAAVLLALLPSAAAAATSEPSPEPTLTAVPEEVAAWFAAEGPRAVESADLGDPADLAVGAPRQVAAWTEEFLAGTDASTPAEPVSEWVAPVMRQSEDAPEPVGVLHAADDGGPTVVEVVADAVFAEALAGAPDASLFVDDDIVDGWFGLIDGEVWPVSEGARGVLQGSLITEVFQDFLATWHGGAGPTPEPAPGEDDGAALSPLVPLGIIVLGGVAAWLLVRQHRQADSRIAADVRAGVEPPPDGESAHPDGEDAAADR